MDDREYWTARAASRAKSQAEAIVGARAARETYHSMRRVNMNEAAAAWAASRRKWLGLAAGYGADKRRMRALAEQAR